MKQNRSKNKNKQKKKRSSSFDGMQLVVPGAALLLLIAVIVLLVYCWKGGFGLHHSSKKNKAKIEENIAVLAQLEQQETQTSFMSISDMERLEKLKENNGIMVDDLEAEKRKISSMDPSTVTKNDLLRRYRNAVVVGDSIAEASMTYGYLDDTVIIAEIGKGLNGMDSYMPAIQGKQPQVIFLTMGLNDIEEYQENVDGFLNAYKSRIQEIQGLVPNAVIYVQSILPVDDRCVEPGHENQPLYNEKLPGMCSELGVYYFDSCFLLDEHPELFDVDGEHPIAQFYPMWFTYMADIAGLDDGE